MARITAATFARPSTTISQADLVFQARGADPELLPSMEMIPAEFKGQGATSAVAQKWLAFQRTWSGGGLPPTTQLYPRDGISAAEAYGHLSVVQGCFGSKHEHKVAAVAWLASLWFEEYDFLGTV